MQLNLKKPNLYIMMGFPGSGKTTWIKKNLPSSYIIISLDEIRRQIFGHKFFRPAEPFIIGTAKAFCRLLMSQNKNIVIDSTGATLGIRMEWCALAKEFKYNKILVVMDTSIKDCIKRDSMRKEKVGKTYINFIKNLGGGYTHDEDYYHFDKIITYRNNKMIIEK